MHDSTDGSWRIRTGNFFIRLPTRSTIPIPACLTTTKEPIENKFHSANLRLVFSQNRMTVINRGGDKIGELEWVVRVGILIPGSIFPLSPGGLDLRDR